MWTWGDWHLKSTFTEVKRLVLKKKKHPKKERAINAHAQDNLELVYIALLTQPRRIEL